MCILHAMYAMDRIIYCVPVHDINCFQSIRTITIQTLDIPQCIQIMARNLPSTVLLITILSCSLLYGCQDIVKILHTIYAQ